MNEYESRNQGGRRRGNMHYGPLEQEGQGNLKKTIIDLNLS